MATMLEQKARLGHILKPTERVDLDREQREQMERSAKVVGRSWRASAERWLKAQGCTLVMANKVLTITGPTGKAVSATTYAQGYRFLAAAGWPGINDISEEAFCK